MTKIAVHKATAMSTPVTDKKGIDVPLGCPTAAEVEISFQNATRDKADVTEYSLQVLKEILAQARIHSATISSISRTAQSQVNAMFNNLYSSNPTIQQNNIANQRALYHNKPGELVVNVFAQMRQSGATQAQIREAMLAETLKIQSSKHPISRHIGQIPSVYNVIDIAPSSIPKYKHKALIHFALAAKESKKLAEFFYPKKDPGFHFEIPQKKEK